jgi:hypothetical protein
VTWEITRIIEPGVDQYGRKGYLVSWKPTDQVWPDSVVPTEDLPPAMLRDFLKSRQGAAGGGGRRRAAARAPRPPPAPPAAPKPDAAPASVSLPAQAKCLSRGALPHNWARLKIRLAALRHDPVLAWISISRCSERIDSSSLTVRHLKMMLTG